MAAVTLACVCLLHADNCVHDLQHTGALPARVHDWVTGSVRAPASTADTTCALLLLLCLHFTTVQLLNPGSLKQALVEGAVRLPDLNMYEQGNGRINLPNSQKMLAAYEPRASVIPPAIDFTDCPYMWPYCTQPLYAFGLPVAFNATIVNGMAVTAQLAGPPVFKATDEGGRLLHVTLKYSEVIWPWSGYMAVFVEVSRQLELHHLWGA